MGLGPVKKQGHVNVVGYSQKYKALVVKGMHMISKDEVAIKMIPKKGLNTAKKDHLRQLIKMYRLVTHQHVVKLHDAFESPTYFYLCLEMLQEKSLWDVILTEDLLSEERAKNIAVKIGQAI